MHRLSPASLWESRSLREALGRGWLAPSAQFVYCGGDRTRARASVATARKGTSSRREGGGSRKCRFRSKQETLNPGHFRMGTPRKEGLLERSCNPRGRPVWEARARSSVVRETALGELFMICFEI